MQLLQNRNLVRSRCYLAPRPALNTWRRIVAYGARISCFRPTPRCSMQAHWIRVGIISVGARLRFANHRRPLSDLGRNVSRERLGAVADRDRSLLRESRLNVGLF